MLYKLNKRRNSFVVLYNFEKISCHNVSISDFCKRSWRNTAPPPKKKNTKQTDYAILNTIVKDFIPFRNIQLKRKLRNQVRILYRKLFRTGIYFAVNSYSAYFLCRKISTLRGNLFSLELVAENYSVLTSSSLTC